MKYIACKFRKEDTRSYTYSYEGPETFVPGDEVQVPDNRSDGWKRVYVVSVSDEAPSFPCKPILGRAPAKEDIDPDIAPLSLNGVSALDDDIAI